MVGSHDRTAKLLQRLDAAWAAFEASYAGLTDAQMTEPGVVEDWSVKDIIAHISTWEEEAQKHLPLIMEGGRPPRYVSVGGIDAFNAQQKRNLPLAEVLRQRDDIHHRLVDFVRNAPGDHFAGDTRARRRLRLDTYSHYPIHTEAIRTWREQRSGGDGSHAAK
jgi:hypothetical protein